jgi:EAL and modified HD-GYP domain-containing signal transduction protein
VAIIWQEMLDKCARISGYVLHPTSLLKGVNVSGTDLLEALENERIVQKAERRKFLIPITNDQWLAADFRRLASPNIYFLLSAKDFVALPDSGWNEQAKAIREAGSGVAVDIELFLSLNDASDFINCLLLDIQGTSLAGFEKKLGEIRQLSPSLAILVDGVSSWSEYRFLMSLGVSYCVGPFSTTPDDTEQAEQISQSRLVVIEMLNMLRGGGDISDIASVAKRDPAVVLKLLEMANSPLSGLSRRVSSIEEAVMLLGHDALYRWLSLAMFRIDGRGDRDKSLMIIALSRAAFLENLAPASNRQIAGELFLVGLFSLMDSLLSMPIDKILHKMHLPDQVESVLLKNEGPYARFLMLALAMERCKIDQAFSLCALIRIDPTQMVNSYSESMAWASADA